MRGSAAGFVLLQGNQFQGPLLISSCTDLLAFVIWIVLDTNLTVSAFGPASHRAEMGYSDAMIRALGCWNSNAFRKYIRMHLA